MEKRPGLLGDPLAIGGVVQVARTGALITTDDAALAEARAQYARCSALVLREFLERSLLDWVRERVRTGVFYVKDHPASGREVCMEPNEAVFLLKFLIQAPDVRHLVEDLTGQRPLEALHARIYRFDPGEDHFHHWHTDFVRNRRVGFSVNLSDDVFEGGNLQLREGGHPGRVVADIRNTGNGDAVLFRLGDDIEHQVLPVTGRAARVALAGWFLCDRTEDG